MWEFAIFIYIKDQMRVTLRIAKRRQNKDLLMID